MPILMVCLSNTRYAHLGGGAHGNTLSAANGRDADKVGAVVAVATDLGALAIQVALIVDLVDDHRALWICISKNVSFHSYRISLTRTW